MSLLIMSNKVISAKVFIYLQTIFFLWKKADDPLFFQSIAFCPASYFKEQTELTPRLQENPTYHLFKCFISDILHQVKCLYFLLPIQLESPTYLQIFLCNSAL